MLTTVPGLTMRPDPEAVAFRAEALVWGGQPILAAWDFWVAKIHELPAVTLAEMETEFIIWRTGFGPPIDFLFAVSSLEARFGVVAETEEEKWEVMRGIILSKTSDTWSGAATVSSEGYRASGEVTGENFIDRTVELTGRTTLTRCLIDGMELRDLGYQYNLIGCIGRPK